MTLEADDAHHLRAVLKAFPGDRIAVLDGSGQEYAAVLEQIGKNRATARLGEPMLLATEPKTKITIAQALPKAADKMEQVLQRGTEIGASGFWAIASERSLTHLEGERQTKRLQRWQSIIKTAAEQSHRAMLPFIRVDGNAQDVFQAAGQYDLALLAYEGETRTMLRDVLSSISTPPCSILVIVGPEGGWTETEFQAAKSHGVVSISLGARILRTETAALVPLSQILFALE